MTTSDTNHDILAPVQAALDRAGAEGINLRAVTDIEDGTPLVNLTYDRGDELALLGSHLPQDAVRIIDCAEKGAGAATVLAAFAAFRVGYQAGCEDGERAGYQAAVEDLEKAGVDSAL